MGWQSIVLIVIIGVLVILAVVKYIMDRKKGKKCAGGCAGCSQANCPSRKALYGQDGQNKDDQNKEEK